MKKRVKKLLSILLSVIIIFAGSITAIAAEVSPEQKENTFTYSYNYDDQVALVGFDYVHIDGYAVRMLGDVNNDREITADDARIALRASSQLTALSAEDSIVADADQDGRITAADARTILRVSARLEDKFHINFPPAPPPPKTIGEFLADIGLDKIIFINTEDTFSSPLLADFKEFDDIDFIIDVLINNSDAELIPDNSPYDIIAPPRFLMEGLLKGKTLYFKVDDPGNFNFYLDICKDVDDNTWIWNSNSNWAAKLENNKDAYDIIVGMISE